MRRPSKPVLVPAIAGTGFEICFGSPLVGQIYEQVYRELLMFMIEDPGTVKRATCLLWASHDLERIADRATKVAERAVSNTTSPVREPRSLRSILSSSESTHSPFR